MNSSSVRSVRSIQLIEVESVSGAGTPQDPARIVRTYWTLEGELVFCNDPYLAEMPSASSNVSSVST